MLEGIQYMGELCPDLYIRCVFMRCVLCFIRSMYVCVPSDCTATSLKFVIRGYELCEYDYQYVLQQESLQTKVGQRKARKDLLRVEQKLAEHPGGLCASAMNESSDLMHYFIDGFPEGYYAYPFRYQLPHGLPGMKSEGV